MLHTDWERTRRTAGICLSELSLAILLDGAMNGHIFVAYVEQVLLPQLVLENIVVIDNLVADKVNGLQETIEAKDAIILYLSIYLTDLNLIKIVFQAAISA
ncbi:MAG: transposase [Sodalis sp. (in: enterobacteria)]